MTWTWRLIFFLNYSCLVGALLLFAATREPFFAFCAVVWAAVLDSKINLG
jgi:hypothetical protein